MKKSILTLAVLSAFASPVFAKDMYATVVLGSSSVPDDGSGTTIKDMSYSLLFGYKINKNYAAEVGYTSLLSNATMNGLPTGFSGTTNLKGFEVAGVASYPINDQFSVFGRLGYASLSGSSEFAFNGVQVDKSDLKLSGLVYGPGIEYNINKQIGVRVGYNIYNLKGSGSSVIVNQLYVSASYSF